MQQLNQGEGNYTRSGRSLQQHFLFFMMSRQLLTGGYYIVVAVHFFTCYYLLSKNGLLAAISFAVLLVNGFLGGIFLIWDNSYRLRLQALHGLAETLAEEDIHKLLLTLPEKTISANRWSGNINAILIKTVSIASFVASATLFVTITLPFIKRLL